MSVLIPLIAVVVMIAVGYALKLLPEHLSWLKWASQAKTHAEGRPTQHSNLTIW